MDLKAANADFGLFWSMNTVPLARIQYESAGIFWNMAFATKATGWGIVAEEHGNIRRRTVIRDKR